MDEKGSINITVLIAGRPYPLKIKANDEGVIRRIVKELNEKINRFQLTYTKKDKQDCLAMTLLTYAVDLHKSRQIQQSTSPAALSEKVQQLEELLDKLL